MSGSNSGATKAMDVSVQKWLRSLAVLETLHRVPGATPAVLSDGDRVQPLLLHEVDFVATGSDSRSCRSSGKRLVTISVSRAAYTCRIAEKTMKTNSNPPVHQGIAKSPLTSLCQSMVMGLLKSTGRVSPPLNRFAQKLSGADSGWSRKCRSRQKCVVGS